MSEIGDTTPEERPAAGPGNGAAERALVRLVAGYQQLGTDAQLAATGTGGVLLDRLLAIDLDESDDGTLVEVVAAANRLAACAEALMAQAAGVLCERESMNPLALADVVTDADSGERTAVAAEKACTAPEELAVRLGWTRNQCRDLVRRGRLVSTHLLGTGEELRRGTIDTGRARAILDSLDDVPWQVALAVEDQVLPTAPSRTAGQLRRDVARALVAVDPAEAERRAERRRTCRRVTRPRALPDETAAMTIEGPAADVLALDTALQAAAAAARAGGDPRTPDQLRFDALATVAAEALATGHLGPEHLSLPLAHTDGRRPEIHVTVSLAHLLPQSGAAAAAAADAADEAGTLRRMVTAPPATDEGGEAGGTALEAPWRHPDDPVTDTGPAIDPDAVPHLTGYGPITPMTARALAAGGIWRRLVTDPLSGRLLDLGHTRYRPSAPLADHVRARDQHCVRPGCSAPARDCQLDHTRPWDHQEPTAGGSTSPANLGPLCHRDHQVKTHGDFQVVQTAPGEFEWTTPTGHRYRRNVDGSSTQLSPSPEIPPF
ncbi:MAG TPA: DUF222 domain-containing protein [Ruania sp.]|nr:DUF222 domain-containing protein [Ruania sp.]